MNGDSPFAPQDKAQIVSPSPSLEPVTAQQRPQARVRKKRSTARHGPKGKKTIVPPLPLDTKDDESLEEGEKTPRRLPSPTLATNRASKIESLSLIHPRPSHHHRRSLIDPHDASKLGPVLRSEPPEPIVIAPSPMAEKQAFAVEPNVDTEAEPLSSLALVSLEQEQTLSRAELNVRPVDLPSASLSFYARLSEIRKSRYTVLLSVCLSVFTDMLYFGCVILLLPALAKLVLSADEASRGAWSQTDYGESVKRQSMFIYLMYAAGHCVMTPFYGIFSDYYRNRKFFLCFGAGSLALSLICLLSWPTSAASIIVSRFAHGSSSAACWVVGLAVIADSFPSEQMGTAMGAVYSLDALGQVVGPFLSWATTATTTTASEKAAGYLLPFYVIACIFVLDASLRAWCQPVKVAHPPHLVRAKIAEAAQQQKQQESVEPNATTTIIMMSEKSPSPVESETLPMASVTEAGREACFSKTVMPNPSMAMGVLTWFDNISVESAEASSISSSSSSNDREETELDIVHMDMNIEDSVDYKKDLELQHGDMKGHKKATDASKPIFDNKRNLNPIKLLQHTEVSLIAATVILGTISMAIIESQLSESLSQKFNIGLQESTYVLLCFIMPNILVPTVIGFVAHHVRGSRLMMLGFFLHSLAPPLLAAANTLPTTILAALYFGMSRAVLMAPCVPELGYAVASIGQSSSFAKVYALYNFCFSVGMLLGPSLSLLVVNHGSPTLATYLFPAINLCFLLVFILFTLRVERKRAGLDHTWPSVFQHLIRNLFYDYHTHSPLT